MRLSTIIKRRPRAGAAVRMLLAAMLIAAWQTALLHPLKHVDSGGGFVHLPGKHLPKAPADRHGPSPLCDAIAGVASCISDATGSLVVAIQVAELPRAGAGLAASGTVASLAYRSQAPPSVL